MPAYLSTDPAAIDSPYLSTDPGALDQAATTPVAATGSEGQQFYPQAQDLGTPEPVPRPVRAAAEYVKGMIPTSLEGLMRAANIPTDLTNPIQDLEFALPFTKPMLDTAQGAQARAQQVQEADQTPPWSQERWNAGVGTVGDILQLAAMGEGAKSMAPPENLSPTRVQPEPPPTAATLGPTTTGLNVHNAMAQMRLNEILANINPPGPRVSPETGFTHFPEEQAASRITPEMATIAPELRYPRGGAAPEPIPPEDAAYAGQQPSQPSTTQPLPNVPEQSAGTSNRVFTEAHGEGAVPPGVGVDTTQLLDNARADISSGAVNPYDVLSRAQAKGIATKEEYAPLAIEHERLSNETVALQKAGDPRAAEVAKQANNFANALQPFKTHTSDLMRLFQGELNYDLSAPFGMEQYMRAELGREAKPSDKAMIDKQSSAVNGAEKAVGPAVERSDAKVQRAFKGVRDIPMEEAAKRVADQLAPCL